MGDAAAEVLLQSLELASDQLLMGLGECLSACPLTLQSCLHVFVFLLQLSTSVFQFCLPLRQHFALDPQRVLLRLREVNFLLQFSFLDG